MKSLALIAALALAACAPRASRVQHAGDATASAPTCREIPADGKPARCEAVAPSALRGN